MKTFTFDQSKNFDANLEAFLQHIANKDKEMGAIFRAYVAKLKGVTDDARRYNAHEFNASVKSALDKLVATMKKEV